MAREPWLMKYDSSCHLAQEIAENIHERNRQKRTGGNPSKLNMTIRTSLQRLQEQISQLKDSLLRSLSTRQITQFEADRRQNLVDDLLTRQRQLQTAFKNDGTEPDVMRVMTSFDVTALFTSINIDLAKETVATLQDESSRQAPQDTNNINKDTTMKRLDLYLTTHFIFNDGI
ncbi:syntaxin-8 [Rhincodon typus]|uniref:syntaxin-8 n=1 Tax=Rhincodon typus TaxID=259920 RepID=UPI002030F2EE|nr:syntaxin-8 [Rhincodon typus]